MTTIAEFVQKWSNGCGNKECATARHVVLARGMVPCDILFIGEAPGISEDCMGLPFQGPAGHLFDLGPNSILDRAYEMVGGDAWKGIVVSNPSYAMANLVGCIPHDKDGKKSSDIPDDQVIRCAPRLIEFVDLCQPKAIITLGELPEAWLDPKQRHGIKLHQTVHKIVMAAAPHPAAILRAESIAHKSRMTNHLISTIVSTIREIMR